MAGMEKSILGRSPLPHADHGIMALARIQTTVIINILFVLYTFNVVKLIVIK